jgi:hypothetical protein
LCYQLAALPESVGNLGALRTLDLIRCFNLKSLPASISQLTQLDETSRKHVEAILRGAPTARPVALARIRACVVRCIAVHACSRGSHRTLHEDDP